MSNRSVSASREIQAEPSVIFDLLADPNAHHTFDGSDTVTKGSETNPERLSLGAKFGMSMTIGPLPYKMSNEVVEFEEDRLIAWRHFGHHIWRYELDATGDGATTVTETFDWGSARFPPLYEWVGYPAKHEVNMAKTLERLAELIENG